MSIYKMEFCPKCDAMLMMKKTKAGCPRCNYVSKEDIDMEMKEKVDEKVEVAVMSRKDGVNPRTDFPCKKCGNQKAYFWIQQMRAGDEPESKFYKCTKCENVERVDD
ncbi:MAG: DNA-directed RNA polymerase subunit M [Patescibacteria group bacterium]